MTAYETLVSARSSLTHWYKLDESAGASSVSDSKGAINSAVVTGVTFGSTAVFSELGTSASFSGSSHIQFNTYWGWPAAWSYEFIYYATSGHTDNYIMANGGGANFDASAIDAGASGTTLAFGSDSNMPTNTVAYNTAYVVTVTYASSLTTLYINGAQIGTKSGTHPTPTVGNRAWIGGCSNSSGSEAVVTGSRFIGRIQHVSTYNAALSLSDNQASYNAATTPAAVPRRQMPLMLCEKLESGVLAPIRRVFGLDGTVWKPGLVRA
jgi:hypothetical protein